MSEDTSLLSPSQAPMLSVVLPVYNEAENIDPLIHRLQETLAALGGSYELLFVDDGSQDDSLKHLRMWHQRDPRIGVLSFSRNFGHHLALTAGLDAAKGDYIVIMDADLQDQPEAIPALYHKLSEGYDVVYGIRQNKQFPWLKKALSASFRWVMRRWIKVPIEGGVFRIMTRRVLEEVKALRETDRLVIGLIDWVGFRQVGVEVPHAARVAGETKYSLGRQLRLGMDALVAFSDLPLRLATWAGLGAVSVACLLLLVWAAGLGTTWGAGWVFVVCAIFLMGGVQLFCVGLLGEYLSRTLTEARRRPLYIVAERREPRQREDENKEGQEDGSVSRSSYNT